MYYDIEKMETITTDAECVRERLCFNRNAADKEDMRMKIDMHCHVKEGSIDSRVGIEEYIEILKSHGFQGMVITDHDTYNGYRYWKRI